MLTPNVRPVLHAGSSPHAPVVNRPTSAHLLYAMPAAHVTVRPNTRSN